jgi:hypothetical protein
MADVEDDRRHGRNEGRERERSVKQEEGIIVNRRDLLQIRGISVTV